MLNLINKLKTYFKQEVFLLTDIEDVMTKKINKINPGASVFEAAKKLEKNKYSCLIVMEKDKIKGIVTERDIVCKYVAKKRDISDKKNIKVGDIMSSPLITLSLDETKNILDAIVRMNRYQIKKLGITKNGKLVGLLCEELLSGFCLGIKNKS